VPVILTLLGALRMHPMMITLTLPLAFALMLILTRKLRRVEDIDDDDPDFLNWIEAWGDQFKFGDDTDDETRVQIRKLI